MRGSRRRSSPCTRCTPRSRPWTIARKDALAALLALAACERWLKDEKTQHADIWPSVLLAAALIAKSSAVAAVPILAVTVWWQNGTIGRRQIQRLAPLALVAGTIVAADALRYAEIDTYRFGHDLATRLGGAGWALAYQTKALVWPIDLTPMRGPYPGQTANELGWWLLGGFVLVALMLLWFRDRIGRGPAAALGCFVIGLSPTLGLVEFSFLRFSVSADRFQYIASIAPIALAGAGVATGLEQARRRWGAGPGIAGWGALISVLAGLSLLSLQQGAVYRDNIAFFTEVNEQIPSNAAMAFNLAKALADKGRYEESAVVSEEGSTRHPHDARLANRSGEALRKLGRHTEAQAAYRKAIALNPGRAWTYIGLGYTLAAQGRRAEAIESFMAAGQRSRRLRGTIAATMAKTQLELGQIEAGDRDLPHRGRASSARSGVAREPGRGAGRHRPEKGSAPAPRACVGARAQSGARTGPAPQARRRRGEKTSGNNARITQGTETWHRTSA